MPTTSSELMTTSELAAYLSISVKTVARWRAHARIPFIKLSTGRYRYRLGEVLHALGVKP